MPLALDMFQPNHDWTPTPTTKPLQLAPDPYVRERGASNLMMLPESYADVHRRGQGYAQQVQSSIRSGKKPSVKIYSSPWSRTQDTARILAHHISRTGTPPQMITTTALSPQSLGELEGQRADQVKSETEKYRTDLTFKPPPGISPLTGAEGEPTDHWLGRLLPFMKGVMSDSEAHPSQVSIISAHSSDMKAMHDWAKADYPDDHKLTSNDEKVNHPRTDRMHIDDSGKWIYTPDVHLADHVVPIRPGIYLEAHGETEYNKSRPELVAANNDSNAGGGFDVRSLGYRPTNPSNSGNANSTPPATRSV